MSAATGLARSVQVRLARHARTIGADPNLVLARYATERLLYRLSRSPHAERFVLKGALLLLVWLGEAFRPTRDADLLGFGDLSERSLVEIFHECCAMEVEPDGLIFDPGSVSVVAIRLEDTYGGRRVTIRARLGSARIKIQVDVGIGDAVDPPAGWIDYPSLLDLPRPRLRAYRPETVVAEKLHTMVALGAANSRMRDFFDVHALAARESFDGAALARAVRATFERRRTAIPRDAPLALTPAFADVAGKRVQWAAFLAKNRITGAPEDFAVTIADLARFALPVMRAAGRAEGFAGHWAPGGPWGRAQISPVTATQQASSRIRPTRTRASRGKARR